MCLLFLNPIMQLTSNFIAKLKTDLDLERLPSGKFHSNFIVCTLASLSLNILGLTGQKITNQKNAPMRHYVKRRRIKIVTLRKLTY